MNVQKMERRVGKIIVFAGPMMAGKSEILIGNLRRAELAREEIMVFRPRIDVRSEDAHIQTHRKDKFSAIAIEKGEEIGKHVKETTTVIGIDEAQFFDETLVGAVEKLRDARKLVYISALDKDFMRRPFGIVPQLLAIADEVHKLKAVCANCGEDATESKREVNSTDTILIGGRDLYKPTCNACYLGDKGKNR